MKVLQECSIILVRKGSDVICRVPDAIELVLVTRSGWIHHKHEEARGFIKLSVMINYSEK